MQYYLFLQQQVIPIFCITFCISTIRLVVESSIFNSIITFIAMLTSNDTLLAQAPTEDVIMPAIEADFAAAAKSQFISFFQNRGFSCATETVQQLKATYNRLTVRFSVSDAKIASDQGHAICYLSFAPSNRRYKIAIANVQEAQNTGSAYTYTLLEDTFARTGSFRQKYDAFYSLEELLNVIFPKATSFTSAITLHSFFSFLF